jgi:hypothetical protein
MLHRFALSALLALGVAALSAPSAEAYDSPKDGYAIDFPSRWQTREQVMGTSVISLSPLESKKDTFAENVNVVVEDLGADATLEAYTEASVKVLKQYLNAPKLVENKRVTLGGYPAQRLVYEHTQGQFKLRGLAYLVVAGSKGYVLTCTAETAQFAKYQAQFEKICRTFVVNEAEATSDDTDV